MGRAPLTGDSIKKMQIADHIIEKWLKTTTGGSTPEVAEVQHLGFFDGGSRGNPGPGGSGSVVVEVRMGGDQDKLVWAACTALASPKTTNNVAEFVGLHRVLSAMVDNGWTRAHIVGDSALIIGMMNERRQPKSRHIQHWYRLARRLADKCQIAKCSHNYRKANKAADWLANFAIDNGKSMVYSATTEVGDHPLYRATANLVQGDLSRWKDS
ncbi:hypothetical protein PC110_g12655 [Phytophthora cactorum]|uniref:RNase H type-1 domain-containing protein n=1 Tax=Phytophthora cactorum TaxID=29920 RepID=A0A329S2S1_9STRA|nr:hypothetical protein PC110_g12655 [Phytophthora cactorum]